MTDLDAVVIGAGQAGLAVAYHLRRTGLSFVLLDDQDAPALARRLRPMDGVRVSDACWGRTQRSCNCGRHCWTAPDTARSASLTIGRHAGAVGYVQQQSPSHVLQQQERLAKKRDIIERKANMSGCGWECSSTYSVASSVRLTDSSPPTQRHPGTTALRAPVGSRPILPTWPPLPALLGSFSS